MKVVPFTQDIQSLLSEFAAAGGCVDHAWVDTGPAGAVWEPAHREAAIAALESLIENQSLFSQWRPLISPGIAHTMLSQRINPATFLGPSFSEQKKQLIVSKQIKHRQITGYFYANEEPAESNIVKLTDPFAREGYAYAFSDPPYRLRVQGAELQTLFDSIVGTLMPKLTDVDTRILQWPTDWSTYFDPGHEWWGSFCWTIEQKELPLLVIIASSTD